MDFFQKEGLFDHFEKGFITRATAGPRNFLKESYKSVSLHRDENLDLVLEFTSDGWEKNSNREYHTGTVRTADEFIEFAHITGAISIAKGVIYRHYQTISSVGKSVETIETFSCSSIHLDLKRDVESSYTIEWVANLPARWIFTEQSSDIKETKFTRTIGSGDSPFILEGVASSSGGRAVLHLKVSDVDISRACQE